MRYLTNRIKWAWQRVFRGYDDRWHWDLFYASSRPIIENLMWLQKNHSGCPNEFYDETKKGDECHKWEDILGKMAQGFEAGLEIDDKMLYKGDEYDKLMEQYNKGMELFVKYYRGLWD